MSPPPVAIRVEDLRKRYGERDVLAGVSLTVAAGEVVALLGPNGAGKTTTVEIVEGYRVADGGHVEVLGEDPRRGGPALRARVGVMLQGGGLDPRARPRELVRLFAAFHDEPLDPDDLIDRVGLGSVARTPVRRLSGGERQHLGLALALVGRPEVLVLDEPTAGMDPEARRATRALIAGLRDAGRAILLTTHDLGDVEQLADRVAILHGGRIVADGTIEELTAQDGGGRVLVRTAAPLDDGRRAALSAAAARAAGSATVLADPASGDPRRLTVAHRGDDGAVLAAVAAWAASAGVRIVELRVAAGSMEDRYFALTGDRADEVPRVDGPRARGGGT